MTDVYPAPPESDQLEAFLTPRRPAEPGQATLLAMPIGDNTPSAYPDNNGPAARKLS